MRGQPDTPTRARHCRGGAAFAAPGPHRLPRQPGRAAHLREAVAEKLTPRQRPALRSRPEILVTDGATLRHLCTALAALLQPGDDVLLPDPIYDAYASPIALWGGRPSPVRSTIREWPIRFRPRRAGSGLHAAQRVCCC